MSSPARSSAPATSVGAQQHGGGGSSGGGNVGGLSSEDDSSFHFPTDLISTQERREEALSVLKAELMSSLDEIVKSMDEDSWKFAAPRSQIHLISRPGCHHNADNTIPVEPDESADCL